MLAAALSSYSAMAGGYQVALQGQRQIGMGHCGTSLALDASSIFFNPGGLSFTKVNNVMMGASFIRSRVAYLAPSPSVYTANTESPIGTPFMLYASFGKKESKLKYGLGVYTPYGSSVKWADDWKGYSLLQSLSLQAIFIQPTVSYKINDMIGIGVGFVYALGSVDLNRGIGAINTANGYASAQLKGSASGMGFNAGVHIQPTEKLSIGASYRSLVNMKVSGGDATFRNIPGFLQANGTFPQGGTTTFDATLPLPAVASIGLGYKLNDKFLLAFDVNYSFWSAYKQLEFEYKDKVNGSNKSTSKRNYVDAPTVRIGAEYMATSNLALRGGLYYDKTPVELGYMTPETPDADRIGITAGIGYKIGERVNIDASFLFIEGRERDQTEEIVAEKQTTTDVLPGTYKLRVLIPGISVSFNF